VAGSEPPFATPLPPVGAASGLITQGTVRIGIHNSGDVRTDLTGRFETPTRITGTVRVQEFGDGGTVEWTGSFVLTRIVS
jgi:hypothetical protein